MANYKGGIIRDGGSLGSGKALGNVKGGIIRGIERERDDEIVAVYHFLIKKFL